jgi:hypothetical protein
MQNRLFSSLVRRLRYRRVGGLRFLRVGRVQLSWRVVRRPSPTPRAYRGWETVEA